MEKNLITSNTTLSKRRCAWIKNDPLYIKYHDEEWGVPVYEDHKLFEFLVLESAEAGLNWLVILKKRENYRKAYEGFDPAIVANFDNNKAMELLRDKGIVRSKLKILSSINNAKSFLEVQKEFGSFSKYIWGFVNNKAIINKWLTTKDVPDDTPLSLKISNDMKGKGFKFIGPKIIYAFMQAVGMVNDHPIYCFKHIGKYRTIKT